MKDKTKEKSKFGETIKNNYFAFKLAYSISKRRVISAFFMKSFDYAGWVYFTAIFTRYIVDALERQKPASTIYFFIILTGIVFTVVNLFVHYTENVTYPLENTKLYYGIYKKLYTKAKNVELRCYEDADFYNRYTMAIDDAGEKVTVIIDSIWGILMGIIAVCMVFYTMLSIEPL